MSEGTFSDVAAYMSRAMQKCVSRAYVDREGSDRPAHPLNLIRVFTVPDTESFDTTTCMNADQRPVHFAHAQNDLNAHFAHVQRHVFA